MIKMGFILPWSCSCCFAFLLLGAAAIFIAVAPPLSAFWPPKPPVGFVRVENVSPGPVWVKVSRERFEGGVEVGSGVECCCLLNEERCLEEE